MNAAYDDGDDCDAVDPHRIIQLDDDRSSGSKGIACSECSECSASTACCSCIDLGATLILFAGDDNSN